MRASDLVAARVYDADGTYVGNVSDVRVVQDGPPLGPWAAALRVDGLLVSPNNTGTYLGYDRGTVRGPWLVRRIVTWLHRHARYARWEDVESWGDATVRLRRTVAELPPVPPLP